MRLYSYLKQIACESPIDPATFNPCINRVDRERFDSLIHMYETCQMGCSLQYVVIYYVIILVTISPSSILSSDMSAN